ncbi:hypothetical protein GCM10010347_63780 [Streptomyces cirratus]|uniref:YNCE-like beta-propeller domain-containing protein n=1 Tax=Streptomyces cirratus TaxID=68187 RepID=A0ABQ3F269_9ACTN|nr:hypothetical protein [Streptomyces cirratus]GHB84088.1 hypothetical protein GCM10010347_63780 [Streptomyces cirratus]
MALAAMASAPGAVAGRAPKPSARPGAFVYVTNLHSDTLSVIDIRTDAVVDSVRVGDRPDSVAVTPDGSHVYVTNSLTDTVSVIEARTRMVVDTIAVGEEPSRVRISLDGRHDTWPT